MKGKMFTNPNGVQQCSSLIHNSDGHDPIGVNPMKSAPTHESVGYYTNTEI